MLLLPFIFSFTGEGLREPKAQFLFVLAALYIGYRLAKEVSPFLALAPVIMAVYAFFCKLGFPSGDLLTIFSAFITCFWVIKPTENELKVSFKILEFLGIVFAIYGFIQICDCDPIQSYFEWAEHRPTIFFGQQTLYGPVAAACFAAALFQRHWIVSIFLFLPAYFIDSSFTYLAYGVVIFLFLWRDFSWKALFLPGILSIAALVAYLHGDLKHDYGHDTHPVVNGLLNDNGRYELWRDTLFLIQKHPYLGYGPMSFGVIFPAFQLKAMREAQGIDETKLSGDAKAFIESAESLHRGYGRFLNAHNDLLNILFEYGALGGIIMLLCILQFYWCFFAGDKSTEAWILCAIFSLFLADSFGNFPNRLVPQCLFPLWSFVAMTTMRRPATISLYEYYARIIRVIPFRKHSL